MTKNIALVCLLLCAQASSAKAVQTKEVFGVLISPQGSHSTSIRGGHVGIDVDDTGAAIVFRADGTQAPFGSATAPLSTGMVSNRPYSTSGVDFDISNACASQTGRVVLWRSAAAPNTVTLSLSNGVAVALGAGSSPRPPDDGGSATRVSCIEFIPVQSSPFMPGETGLWVDAATNTLKARKLDGTDTVAGCAQQSGAAYVDRATCATPACSYAATYPGCWNPDTDGDGYGDAWEVQQGIDLNCDGTVAASEKVLVGANAAVKDIFVAYDWMAKDTVAFPNEAQHQPLPDSFVVYDVRGDEVGSIAGPIPRVVAAFQAHNIALHVEQNTNASGQVTSPLTHYTVLSFANPPGSAVHPINCPDATCGNFAACVGSDAGSFYQVKAANFNPNKALTHRYMVFAHSAHCPIANCGSAACNDAAAALGMCSSSSSGYAGLTRNSGTALFGTDFIVSLGALGLSDGSGEQDPALATERRDDLDRYQAGLFMHELGHTLGLNHGGATSPVTSCVSSQNNLDRKPNYVSVMNFFFQSGIYRADVPGSAVPVPPAIPYAQSLTGDWQVDYSSSIFPLLNENALDDALGIQAGSNVISFAYNGAGTPANAIPGVGVVDWNRSGTLESGVVADVNGDGFFTTLTGFDDWGNLQLPFQCRPPGP